MYPKSIYQLIALFILTSLMGLSIEAQWLQPYPELYPSTDITNNNGNKVYMFEGVIETKDLGFITWGAYDYAGSISGGSNQLPVIPITVRLTKTDLAGNVQWTQLYEPGLSDPAFADLASFTMAASPDGNGYLAIGKTLNSTVSTFRTIRLDEQGGVLNTSEFTEVDAIGVTSYAPYTTPSTTKIVEIVPSPDNTFVVLASNYYPYFTGGVATQNFSWLSKVDMDGNLIWGSEINSTFPNPYGVVTTAVLFMGGLDVASTGDIYTAGGVYSWSQELLYKYDPNGNEVWFQTTTVNSVNHFADVIAHPSGDIYVKGHQYGWSGVMARLTSAGDTIWADTSAVLLDTESSEFIPVDFCVLNDGNIGLLEMQTDDYYTENQNLRFSAIDEDNNYLYTGNSYSSSLFDYVSTFFGQAPREINLISTNDNSMVLAGQYSLGTGGNIETYNVAYPYIAKPGPNGEIPVNSLSGYVFIDANSNCIYDAGEVGIPNEIVSSEYTASLTDENGYYEMNIPFVEIAGAVDANDNLYTNFGQAYPEDYWISNCDDNLEVTLEVDGSIVEGLDFGFVPIFECPRLEVNLLIGILRPGFSTTSAFISYENTGTLLEDSASIYLTMDSLYSITPGTSSVPFVFDAASGTYEFFIGEIDVFESGGIFFQLTTDATIPIGSTPCFEAFILPFDRCNLNVPDWDGSETRVTGVCEGDSILFVMENIGEEDMELSREYSVYADDLLIQVGDAQLDSGEIMEIRKVANGLSYRMEAEQSPNFPEPSFPQATVESCNSTDGPSSTGFVNTNPQDDERHYVDIDCVVVSGSYDPNDKLVAPFGIGSSNYVNADVELEYTIRFQNTGTDTAFNVFILDTLSEYLDINTFESGAASHEFELSILPNRVVRWDFPNILLPDSTTNLAGSNGAVQFSIRSVAGIPQPTEIHNVAGIYFDFNAPVITEDMFVTICDECLIQTLASDGVYFDGKVLLEGPYDGAGLMTNNLQDLIPMNQPFANFPYYYDGTEQLPQVPANMVDWVLVEARSGTPATSGERATTTVETKAAILLNDGSIRGLDGIEGVRFVNLTSDESYHFCIRHRNHLDILTATALFPTENMVYDFTTGTSQALGAAQMKWFGADAKAVMYSGDFNSDGVIQTTDYDIWSTQPAAVEVYDMPDANLDGVIQVSDYDKWFFNKAKVGSVEIGF